MTAVTPAAMPGAKPIPPKPEPAAETAPSGLDAVAGMTDPAHPWMAAVLAGTQLADALLPPVLQPLPPSPKPPMTARTGPLYGLQFLRKEALRFAIEFYRDAIDDADAPPLTDTEVVVTADRFAEYIRSGIVPNREKEA